MDPFGFLNKAQWSFEDETKYPTTPLPPNSITIVNNLIVQRVFNTSKVAVTASSETALPPPYLTFNEAAEIDIESIWQPQNVEVDMDPHLPSTYIEKQYNETLIQQDPLALFPKQVLSRARIGITEQEYINSLLKLVSTTSEIDAKYTNNEFIDVEIKKLCGDISLNDKIKQLKLRETQLQVLVCLELKSINNELVEDSLVDKHFNRLCIWFSVENSSEELTDFCTQVILPFFKSNCLSKVKQYLKICRGTLRSGPKRKSRNQPPLAELEVKLPAVPGIARALRMQNLASPDREPELLAEKEKEKEKAQVQSSSLLGSSANKTLSHPLYRQASQVSRQNTVEVRFKHSKRTQSSIHKSKMSNSMHLPKPVSRSRTLPQPSLPNDDKDKPTNMEPHLTQPSEKRRHEDTIEATPAKVRSVYLQSLPAPESLQWDQEEIGSTDSD